MAKSVLSSDTLPKAGRVNEGTMHFFPTPLVTHESESLYSTDMSNEYSFDDVAVCREWLVHEDGALAYRLQDEESKNITSSFCDILDFY